MRFELRARIVFSRDMTDSSSRVGEALEEANKDLLLRGVPKDLDDKVSAGAQVKEWRVEGAELHLHLASGTYVRAHEAVLRLRKQLGQELGKELRAGIRQVFLDEYRAIFELPQEPRRPLTIPFAKEVHVEGKTCTLVIENVSEELIKKNSIDRMITRLQKKAASHHYEGKAEFWEIMETHGQNRAFWSRDPTEAMVEQGWLKQGPTKGKWFFRPQLARVMRTMQEIAVKEFLDPLGFQEVVESHMVPFDVWIKTGHMEGVPNEIYYISEPKTRDVGEWEEFIDHVNITRQVPLDILGGLLNPPNAGACYAQCPVMYWSLQGETVADKSLPILIYDRTANSNRYESGGRHGIERVDEFHRIEPVYIGTA
ncbi:MAG: serine--tRNA ligase, partial [Candidatus Thermoplasmatota archaeon]|nr:serine--tRNA ligase [Candidatus Thermoplasmatota archaeon]